MRTLWRCRLLIFLMLASCAHTSAVAPILGAALLPALGFLVSTGTAVRMAAYGALGLAGIRLAENAFDIEILSSQTDGEAVEHAETVLADFETKFEPLFSTVADEMVCIRAAAQGKLCTNATAFGKEVGRIDNELKHVVTRLDSRRKKLIGHQDHFSVQMRTAIEELIRRAGAFRQKLEKVRAVMVNHAAYFELYNQLETLKNSLQVFAKHNGQGYRHALFVKDRAQVTAIANKARICAYVDLLSMALETDQVIGSLHTCAP